MHLPTHPYNCSAPSLDSLFVAITASPKSCLASVYVNKPTPIYFIDGKCNKKQLKAGKSRKTNYTQSISHHWLIML